MKITWKGEHLGEFNLEEGLDVQEMIRVRRELGKAYGNQRIFLSAVFDLSKDVIERDADGKPVLGEDRKPLTRKEPSEDWDPEAWAMFVVLMHGRAGKKIYIEDVQGVLGDLDAEADAEELERLAEAAGKARAEQDRVETPPTDATPSSDGSTDTPPDSGPTSDSLP